ncbi:hypothetical protein FRC04_005047 [Tulasnella sp. 424]|nr:hypothetical protein FRC04_005047 [Tulasnella sp. 424]
MVSVQNAAKALPHIKNISDLLELLPYWTTSPNHPDKYYPIRAIEQLSVRYAAASAQGQDKLSEFKEKMLAQRKAIRESVAGFKEWEAGLSVADANRKIASAKLLALGYSETDIYSILHSTLVRSRTPLTEARWATVGPQLEALVKQANEHRLGRYRDTTIGGRKQFARERIQIYFDGRPGLEAIFRPTAEAVTRLFPGFKSVVEQPLDALVLPEHFDLAMEALPALLKEYADSKKRHIVRRMVEGGAENVPSPPTEEDLDKVFYATTIFFSKTSKLDMPICVDSVFERRLCWLFNVGLEEVDGTFRRLTFNSKASGAVGALLRCARLEYTTTVEDLDARDLRFHCLGCEGRERKLARSWRDCAHHAKEAKHCTENWELLNDEDASTVRALEASNLNDEVPRFYCNRCPFSWRTHWQFARLRPLGDLVEHLKME